MNTGLIWSEIKQLWDMGLKEYVSNFSSLNIPQLVLFGFNLLVLDFVNNKWKRRKGVSFGFN